VSIQGIAEKVAKRSRLLAFVSGKKSALIKIISFSAAIVGIGLAFVGVAVGSGIIATAAILQILDVILDTVGVVHIKSVARIAEFGLTKKAGALRAVT